MLHLTEDSFTEVERFTNLGPILDFVTVDPDKTGQNYMVACCNGHKEGSLKIIRNGIGVREVSAGMDCEGASGVWSLKTTNSEYVFFSNVDYVSSNTLSGLMTFSFFLF